MFNDIHNFWRWITSDPNLYWNLTLNIVLIHITKIDNNIKIARVSQLFRSLQNIKFYIKRFMRVYRFLETGLKFQCTPHMHGIIFAMCISVPSIQYAWLCMALIPLKWIDRHRLTRTGHCSHHSILIEFFIN